MTTILGAPPMGFSLGGCPVFELFCPTDIPEKAEFPLRGSPVACCCRAGFAGIGLFTGSGIFAGTGFFAGVEFFAGLRFFAGMGFFGEMGLFASIEYIADIKSSSSMGFFVSIGIFDDIRFLYWDGVRRTFSGGARCSALLQKRKYTLPRANPIGRCLLEIPAPGL